MQVNGQTLPLYPQPPADPDLRPADALLRESTPCQSQYSAETQHEQICSAMARHGYYPACIDGDEERGRVTTRAGYQRIKARVTKGLTEAVFVFHSSRLGRDASERLKLQRELKKLRVPIYSCQQGEIRADVVGGVYALMDEQFSVDLAFKIKNAMPQAVKAGRYPTRTPVGYKRQWPQGEDAKYDRKSRPEMVKDEHYGPLVQDIFRKYGEEGWTIRAIVGWLNSQVDRYPNPNSESGKWNIGWVCRMLRMRVYVGEIEWGKEKNGYYENYDGPVLRSGEGDCGPARHDALIERPLWEAVQARLANEEPRRTTVTRKGRRPAVLSGILVCRSCGGPMRALHTTPDGRGTSWGQYVCVARERKQSDCSEPDCSMRAADAAVLREVARLVPGRPWEPSAPGDLAVQDSHAAERARLEAQVASARREVERNIRLLKLVDDPDEETLAAFRRDNRQLSDQIKTLQAQLEALPRTTVEPITIVKLHAELAGTDLAQEIARAQEQGDVLRLRRLVGDTVQSARIVERRPGGGKTRWARAEVIWTDQVSRLLEHGYLLLAAPAEAPEATSVAERMRRYRARRRAAKAEQSLDGLLSVDQAAQELGMTPGGLRSAIVRGVITPVRLAAYPRRAFLTPQEVERYRAQHLGRRGRRPT
jgi:DNA invertase Pin-like site-specific DNA recombinase